MGASRQCLDRSIDRSPWRRACARRRSTQHSRPLRSRRKATAPRTVGIPRRSPLNWSTCVTCVQQRFHLVHDINSAQIQTNNMTQPRTTTFGMAPPPELDCEHQYRPFSGSFVKPATRSGTMLLQRPPTQYYLSWPSFFFGQGFGGVDIQANAPAPNLCLL